MTRLKDEEWIRQSFLLPAGSIVDAEAVRRTMKDARFKFTDSSLGGNFAINPPPQFTPWADLSVKSTYAVNSGGAYATGMGRYYSEAIDNNSVLVHMRFGVPKYNSLLSFFGSFYSPQAASFANTGRGKGVFFNAAKAIGHFVTIPLSPLILANRLYRFFFNKPVSKYYYLKPAMPLYWNAVQTTLNAIAVNMGIAQPVSSDLEQELYPNEDHLTVSDAKTLQNYRQSLGKGSMDFWTDGGSIDIRKVATRAQRMANKQREEVQKIYETSESAEALATAIARHVSSHMSLHKELNYKTHGDYRDAYFNLEEHQENLNLQNGSEYMGGEEIVDEETGNSTFVARWFNDRIANVTASIKQFGEFVEAEFQDGSQFVTFKVDNPGTIGESFSNSTSESSLSQSLNSANSAARSARFNFANGNTGSGIIDNAYEFVGNVISGLADGVGLTGLTAFAGNAFADIPKVWDGSTANLPRADYTIELRSPYGNKLSRFMHLYVPLSMLLAGTLPLSAGKQSYTSPFICELYVQGRNQIRLGMIESLSITRGAGNIGWTQDNEPLGIDVSFSVVDLSTIMHMPIHTGMPFSDKAITTGASVAMMAMGPLGFIGGASNLINQATSGMLDDDNAFTDYMAVLGSLSLMDQINPYHKLRKAAAKRVTDFETTYTLANLAQTFMGGDIPRAISRIRLGSGAILGN